MDCFEILPERALNVMFLFIAKFKDSAKIKDKSFDIAKGKIRKNKLKDIISRVAPDAPAKQNEKNLPKCFIIIFVLLII